MDINNTVNEVISYAESNPIIAGVVAVVLLYLLIKKPKVLFGLIVIAILLGAVMKMLDKLFEIAAF